MLRCALVSNVHLSVLAQKLQLDKYFVYVHAQDLARKEDLNNALANCFEGNGCVNFKFFSKFLNFSITLFIYLQPNCKPCWVQCTWTAA